MLFEAPCHTTNGIADAIAEINAATAVKINSITSQAPSMNRGIPDGAGIGAFNYWWINIIPSRDKIRNCLKLGTEKSARRG